VRDTLSPYSSFNFAIVSLSEIGDSFASALATFSRRGVGLARRSCSSWRTRRFNLSSRSRLRSSFSCCYAASRHSSTQKTGTATTRQWCVLVCACSPRKPLAFVAFLSCRQSASMGGHLKSLGIMAQHARQRWARFRGWGTCEKCRIYKGFLRSERLKTASSSAGFETRPYTPATPDQAELDGLTNGCSRGLRSAAGGRRHGAAG
jgi:hypothetical protein